MEINTKSIGLILILVAMLLGGCMTPVEVVPILTDEQIQQQLYQETINQQATRIAELEVEVATAQALPVKVIEPSYELVLPDGTHYAYVWEQETSAGTICTWTEGSYEPVCSCPCEVICVSTTTITHTPVPVDPTPTPVDPTPEPTPEPPDECKPGHGHGDKNHCHSGPPGQNK